uniref:Uncharacterized protein n=1 Tax=Helianthus annuus TaxID=4232 RepID=A0A251ULD0_HELAN
MRRRGKVSEGWSPPYVADDSRFAPKSTTLSVCVYIYIHFDFNCHLKYINIYE